MQSSKVVTLFGGYISTQQRYPAIIHHNIIVFICLYYVWIAVCP